MCIWYTFAGGHAVLFLDLWHNVLYDALWFALASSGKLWRLNIAFIRSFVHSCQFAILSIPLMLFCYLVFHVRRWLAFNCCVFHRSISPSLKYPYISAQKGEGAFYTIWLQQSVTQISDPTHPATAFLQSWFACILYSCFLVVLLLTAVWFYVWLIFFYLFG